MSIPSDRGEEPGKPTKIGRVTTGFRDIALDQGRGLKPVKVGKNPQDRRNMIYVVTSLVLLIVMIVLLELKQMHDAKLEPEFPTKTALQNK